MTNVLRVFIAVSALLLCRVFVAAQINQPNQSTQANQASCLSPDEAKVLLAEVNSPRNSTFNKKLHDELLNQVMGSRALERRRVVVIMSDGVDNALGGSNLGSQISFADLLEAVRKSDELIIPIYLDTERDREYMSVAGTLNGTARTLL